MNQPTNFQIFLKVSELSDLFPQWECKADMDSRYRFGDIAVNCEGYNYPDDPYILKGSCGVGVNFFYDIIIQVDRCQSKYPTSHTFNHQKNL